MRQDEPFCTVTFAVMRGFGAVLHVYVRLDGFNDI